MAKKILGIMLVAAIVLGVGASVVVAKSGTAKANIFWTDDED